MKQSVGSIEGSRTSNMFFLAALGTLMAFTSLSTDMYLPALPEMQKDLHGNMELTITGFLIGFSIAQIFWGPISDRFGRKRPLPWVCFYSSLVPSVARCRVIFRT